MQERTKNNLKEILEVLLSAWETGEDPISDSEIARRMVNKGRKITNKKTKRGKPSLQNTRKEVNNLLSVERSKEYPALFTIEKHGAHNSNLHEITLNGIFWLFREDGISFKRFLNDFSRIALDSLYRFYDRATQPDSPGGELFPEDKKTLEIDKEYSAKAIEQLNRFFEYYPEKRTGELVKKYLRRYDLEKYPLPDFQLLCIVRNLIQIFGQISAEDYEEDLCCNYYYEYIMNDIFMVEEDVMSDIFMEEGEGSLITLFEVFEIPKSKS